MNPTSLVFATIFLVFAVIFLMGKGDKLIAGYNTASEEEKQKIDIKRLRILMAILSMITAGYICTLPYLDKDPKNQMWGLFAFLLVTLLFIILANTWAKKKK